MSPLKSMIMIWALNLLSEIIKTADLIYNSWPNINCNSCMECNLEENVPLEIVFTDQITRDKPGAGSAHQDKFIFYETWPCLCVSPHWRHNQHISDIAHCSFKNQIVSICWQTNSWAFDSALTMTVTNSPTDNNNSIHKLALNNNCRVVVKRVHSNSVTTIIAKMPNLNLQRPKVSFSW